MAPCEAMVFWQWMNFALAAAPEGRPSLVVNMDETSLVRHANGLVGTVVKNWGGNKVGDKAASLAARRSCMTFMAAITHDTAVQPKLPQVLIGNKHQLTAQVLRDAKPLPHNIHVFKEETAWNNHAVMRRYISLLAKALGDMVKQRYVILLLDVHRSHIDKSIFVHARRCGLRLCYVPALMTAELQPCDTHLFSRFKSAFQELWRRQRALAVAGSLTTAEWLLVVGAAIQKVLPATRWRPAFEATGILGQQSRVSASLLRNLSWIHVPTVPAGAPEDAVAAVVFPNGMQVDISSYVLWQPQSASKTKKTSRRGSLATTTGATSASKAVATHIPTDTSNTGLTLCLATWEDRVKVDDFNCVFWAGKRGRRKQQVGRVPDTSKPLPRLKTVRDKVTEWVSSDMQQKHVVSMWTCT